MKTGEFASWDILSDKVAVKHTDKSVFIHRGTVIPIETRRFWGVENIRPGESHPITLNFDGSSYDAKISIEVRQRTRLFWSKELSEKLNTVYFGGTFPLMRFEKIDADVYDVTIEQSAAISDSRDTLYDDFLKEFPISSLGAMPLEKYTNTNRPASFI